MQYVNEGMQSMICKDQAKMAARLQDKPGCRRQGNENRQVVEVKSMEQLMEKRPCKIKKDEKGGQKKKRKNKMAGKGWTLDALLSRCVGKFPERIQK